MTLSVATGALLSAATVAALLIRRRLIVVSVSGLSMQPTLQPGDRVLVQRGVGRRLRTGALAVVVAPHAPLEDCPSAQRPLLIKRIAASAGEPLPVHLTTGALSGLTVVPAGHVVVLGDNLDASVDSRQLGPISVQDVLGTVVRRMG